MSMVMPRSFSSFSRSASMPVSALTSDVLPWSMCPAVPTTMWAIPSILAESTSYKLSRCPWRGFRRVPWRLLLVVTLHLRLAALAQAPGPAVTACSSDPRFQQARAFIKTRPRAVRARAGHADRDPGAAVQGGAARAGLSRDAEGARPERRRDGSGRQRHGRPQGHRRRADAGRAGAPRHGVSRRHRRQGQARGHAPDGAGRRRRYPRPGADALGHPRDERREVQHRAPTSCSSATSARKARGICAA